MRRVGGIDELKRISAAAPDEPTCMAALSEVFLDPPPRYADIVRFDPFSPAYRQRVGGILGAVSGRDSYRPEESEKTDYLDAHEAQAFLVPSIY